MRPHPVPWLLALLLSLASFQALAFLEPDGCNPDRPFGDEFGVVGGNVKTVKYTIYKGNGVLDESKIESYDERGHLVETVDARGFRDTYTWRDDHLIEQRRILPDTGQPGAKKQESGKTSHITSYGYDDKGALYRKIRKEFVSGKLVGKYIHRALKPSGSLETCLDFGYGSDAVNVAYFDAQGRPVGRGSKFLETPLNAQGERAIYEQLASASSRGGHIDFPIKYEATEEGVKVIELMDISNRPVKVTWYDKGGRKREEVSYSTGQENHREAYDYRDDDRGNWIVRQRNDWQFLGMDKAQKYDWVPAQRIERQITYR